MAQKHISLKRLTQKLMFGWLPRSWELGIRHRLHRVKSHLAPQIRYFPKKGGRVVVLAGAACQEQACQVLGYLEKAGFECGLIHSAPVRWEACFHLILAPQSLELTTLPEHYAVLLADEGEKCQQVMRGAVATLVPDMNALSVWYGKGFSMAQLYYCPLQEEGGDMAEFYFMRFLLAFAAIDFATFYRLAGHHITFTSDKICLGLPEAVARYRHVHSEAGYRGFQYVPGLRFSPGWIGCGMSYKFLMAKAKETDYKAVAIAEDDIDFLPGWDRRLALALKYLQGPECGDWHVFAALVAEIHPKARCSKVSRYQGERYVHLDKMVSMVLNIYHRSFFDTLSGWNEKDDYVVANTIDRYIESRRNLSVVVPEPYLIGHLDDMTSTLWNKSNGEGYSDSFAKSRRVIKEIADAWESGHVKDR